MSEIEIIKKYLGIPYKNRGRDLSGLDCWGLVLMIYKDININLPDLEKYDIKWSYKGKNYIMERYTNDWVRVDKPRLLDIILIKNSKGIVNHAGVMLDSSKFIHCPKAGVVLGGANDKLWKDRIEGFFRNDKLILQTDKI